MVASGKAAGLAVVLSAAAVSILAMPAGGFAAPPTDCPRLSCPANASVPVIQGAVRVAQAVPARGRGSDVFEEPVRFDPPPGETRAAAWGAGRTVCVRMCDGFFFPLPAAVSGGARPSDLCAASCPAAVTEVFYLGDDGTIESAIGDSGRAYGLLPNAGRYRRVFDPACGCRKSGASWATTLNDAERIIQRRRTDTILNEQLADSMSRRAAPAAANSAAERRRREEVQADEAVDDATRRALAEAAQAASTAGTESAGIGQGPGASGVMPLTAGEVRDAPAPGGGRRPVRVLFPNGGWGVSQ